METVMARLDVEIFVDCPKCEYMIDILREEDTDGYNHNEEGDIMGQAFPDKTWFNAHKNFSVENVTCSKCKTIFNVKELEW